MVRASGDLSNLSRPETRSDRPRGAIYDVFRVEGELYRRRSPGSTAAPPACPEIDQTSVLLGPDHGPAGELEAADSRDRKIGHHQIRTGLRE